MTDAAFTIFHNPSCGTSRKWTEDQLIAFMVQQPIRMNRPIVQTPLGTKLCRPSDVVLDILPSPQRAAFTKEDGERVVAAEGRHVVR